MHAWLRIGTGRLTYADEERRCDRQVEAEILALDDDVSGEVVEAALAHYLYRSSQILGISGRLRSGTRVAGCLFGSSRIQKRGVG